MAERKRQITVKSHPRTFNPSKLPPRDGVGKFKKKKKAGRKKAPAGASGGRSGQGRLF